MNLSFKRIKMLKAIRASSTPMSAGRGMFIP